MLVGGYTFLYSLCVCVADVQLSERVALKCPYQIDDTTVSRTCTQHFNSCGSLFPDYVLSSVQALPDTLCAWQAARIHGGIRLCTDNRLNNFPTDVICIYRDQSTLARLDLEVSRVRHFTRTSDIMSSMRACSMKPTAVRKTTSTSVRVQCSIPSKIASTSLPQPDANASISSTGWFASKTTCCVTKLGLKTCSCVFLPVLNM